MKIHNMREAGRANLGAIQYGFIKAEPGVTLKEIDGIIEWYIRQAGCKPAFLNYQPTGYPIPFPATACLSVNDVVVHGLPNDYTLKNGDLLTIDVGTECDGWFVDAARTRIIGEGTSSARHLLQATDDVLAAQLAVIKPGCSLYDIIVAADSVAGSRGVAIMPQWGGHSIGKAIHEPPFIPNAFDKSLSPTKAYLANEEYKRYKLSEGQTICIEPVVTYGSIDTIVDEDQWTIRKVDGNLSAHTERCLYINKDGYEILT